MQTPALFIQKACIMPSLAPMERGMARRCISCGLRLKR